LREFTSGLKGAPEIAGPAASVDRAAFDTHGYTSWTEILKGSSLLLTLACYPSDGPAAPTPIQNESKRLLILQDFLPQSVTTKRLWRTL
jgi:hypothetical protein